MTSFSISSGSATSAKAAPQEGQNLEPSGASAPHDGHVVIDPRIGAVALPEKRWFHETLGLGALVSRVLLLTRAKDSDDFQDFP